MGLEIETSNSTSTKHTGTSTKGVISLSQNELNIIHEKRHMMLIKTSDSKPLVHVGKVLPKMSRVAPPVKGDSATNGSP